MAYSGIWQDNLPWSDTENDRKVVGYILISLFVCTLLYVIVQFLPVPPVKEQKLEVVAPRLAKLIIEKQQKPPPPLPVPAQKKPVPKPKQTEKPKPQPKKVAPRKTEPVKPDRTAVARRQAQQHITEIQDALADLRDVDVAASIEHNKPVHRGSHSGKNTDNTTAVIAAQANKGSGGINTSHLSRATGDSRLKGRQTTAVTSTLATAQARNQGGGSGGAGKTRPYDEIELTFQKNKGSIVNIYNRALRRDPTLQGTVKVELTIAASGQVTKVRILSSDIKDAQLLEQLKARIRLFRFKPMNVDTLIVSYPIELLPNS